MKITSYAVGRPNYYDRGATSVINFYYAVAAPHGATTRWSYTVAAGKKLLVEAQFARLARQSAASTAGQYHAEMVVSSGVSNILTASIHSIDNTTTLQSVSTPQQQMSVYAAEVVSAVTYDTSTGGTVEYYVGHKATLFDA